MVWAAAKMIHFFKHESCGKCTPCREGTYWLDKIYERLLHGGGTAHDLDLLATVPTHMQGGVTLCALGEFAANPVLGTIHQFRDEYERYVSAAAVKETAAAGVVI
jgi:NADH-quinone oxidoreductase subunit F